MNLHWIEKLEDKIIEERGEKTKYIFNSGMSVSGMMHIGNLRGEMLIPSRVGRELEKKGKEVSFKGTYYTQDRFKGTKEQLNQFDDTEKAKEYVGWRLIDVPDPAGCHDNWVDHFNSYNSPYLKEFGIDVDTFTTTEFYRKKKTKELIKKFLENRKNVIDILNNFRERNPFPRNWIPFDSLCKNCNRIDKTKAKEIDFKNEKVRYNCSSCNHEGWSNFTEGKLTWRLEWAAIWEILNVDFEQYGVDHAVPGGSRDSCVAVCKELNLNYPTGFVFNWVHWKENENVREMSSSKNVGITAKTFLEIADPDILNYLYISTKPMKEIYFNPNDLPAYYRRFDEAERVYFGTVEEKSKKREYNLKRSYELALKNIPDEKPVRVPYDVCSFVVQLGADEKEELRTLEEMGQIPTDLKEKDRERVLKRLKNAENWINKFEPENYTVKVKKEMDSKTMRELSRKQKNVLIKLREMLKENQWNSDNLQQEIYEMKDKFDISERELFQGIYLAILGKKSGPRAGLLIKGVGEEKVVNILEKIS